VILAGGQVEQSSKVRASFLHRGLQHHDLGARVWDANHSVQEFSLYHRPRALDFETECDEERRHQVQILNSDADVVEAKRGRHEVRPPVLVYLSIPHSKVEFF
jgi:hypothetical protein